MGKLRNLLFGLTIVALMVMAGYVGFILAFKNLVLPRVSIAGVEVSGMDKQSAQKLVDLYTSSNPSQVILRYNGKENHKFENFKVSYDVVWAVDQAMAAGRSGNILTRVSEQFKNLVNSYLVQLPIQYDTDEMEGILDDVENQMNQTPVWPKLTVTQEGIKLTNGQNGITVRRDELKKEILANLALPGKHLIDIPMEVVMAEEKPDQTSRAIEVAKKWVNKKITLKAGSQSVQVGSDQIISLFGLMNNPIDQQQFETLVNNIKPAIETEPKDAVFVFKDNKVSEFKPEIVGAKIDIPAFQNKLADFLYSGEGDSLDVPTILSYPKIRTGDINNLGIKELIGKGTSTFFHSIPGRVFNVNLASTRINGVIVPPGGEFSFNDNVGEISRDTGYQSAYIISGGKTVLGDGGGVCQVSTTVFRAALNAGLPITERKAHAYRVGYYEQDSKPGLDATVFSPSADLKFKNDTGNHILIQTIVDTKNLTMEVDIYGTSDGRKVSLSEPKITGQVAPPPTLYVDDPTLPLGTTKQVDWSAWGSKVSFNYKVTRGGETLIDKTFYSNYQPWQAIFMRGTNTSIASK